MSAIHLTTEEFSKKVTDLKDVEKGFKYLGDNPCIVDFFADWCGPCKSISPILEELSEENKDIILYKVNIDEEQEVAAAFGIRSIPTLLFIPIDGKPQMTQGAAPKTDLQRAIDTILLKK